MPVTLLDSATEAKLRAARFTYPEVGRTAGELPTGYTAFSRTSTLSSRDFGATTAALLGWHLQLRSGLKVAASSAQVAVDAVVVLRLGFGLIGVNAPCRVVYVVDEPPRQGFAYGTLPGHPESGEEAFMLALADDGRITLTISAFSRPATTLTKLGGPVGRAVQRAMTARYLRALDR